MLLMMFHYICKHTQSLQGQKQVSKQITGRKRLPEPNGSVHVNEKKRKKGAKKPVEKIEDKIELIKCLVIFLATFHLFLCSSADLKQQQLLLLLYVIDDDIITQLSPLDTVT